MTLLEHYDRQIPDYYDGMHRDGYTPQQILHALRRKMAYAHFARQEAAEQNEVMNVKITSEVRIK